MSRDTQSIFNAMLESKRNRSASKKNNYTESKLNVNNGFTGRLLRESIGEDVPDDVLDNIQVVTDPNKNIDELETRADEIQDAIDNAEEAEEAFSDEYIGDRVYACPCCGESFFAEEEYQEGDVCPICKAEPSNGFLLQGVVKPIEDAEEDEEVKEPEESEETKSIENAEPAEDEAEVDLGKDEESDDVVESKKCKAESDKEDKKSIKIECDQKPQEIEVTIDLDDNKIEIEKEPAELEAELDEKSFEDNLNQFAEENYGQSIDEITVDEACYDPDADELCLECTARCKNKNVPLSFRLKESRCIGNKAVLVATEANNVFKMESKKPSFAFKVVNTNNKIVCESMKYSFITRHSKAGRVKVEGYCKSKRNQVR